MTLKYTSLHSRNPDFVKLSGELSISRFPSVFSQGKFCSKGHYLLPLLLMAVEPGFHSAFKQGKDL